MAIDRKPGPGIGWVASVGLLAAAPVSWAATAADSPDPQAADQTEQVIVTARKRVEKMQDVPASISAVTAAQMTAAGINDMKAVVATVPNVSFSGGIAGELQGQVGIRGISTLVRNIGVESGVGFYVDGVYLGRSDAYNQELIDIERVEVLRGPQGSLFGKNTIAGVFNVSTKTPGNRLEGQARIEAGNYQLWRGQAYVMGPVSDTVSAKLALGYVSRNGTYKNLSGGPDGDAVSLGTLRGQVYFRPTADDSLIFSVDGLRDRGRPAFFQVTRLNGASGNAITQANTPHTIDNNQPEYLHRDNVGLSVTYKHRADFGDITSITAYRKNKYQASLDDDQNRVDYLSADRWGDVTKILSQELRLNGDLGPSTEYLVGAYYSDQTVTTDRILTIGNDLLGVPLGYPSLTTQGSAKSKSVAIFGSLDYQLSKSTTLTVGLRYTSERKDVNFVQGDASGIFTSIGLPNLAYNAAVTHSDVAPTVSLSYRLSPNVMAYGRVAQGFKSAAFNVDLVGSTLGLSAGPENATTYEVGLKSDLFDRTVRANLGLFTTAYKNLQVSQLLGGGVSLTNAGRATISGFEGEFAFVPNRHLRLDAALGLLRPTYDRYANCGVPASLGGGVTDCSGKQLVGAPRFTGRVAGEYVLPLAYGDLVLHAAVTSESKVYFDATNAEQFSANGHTLLDARVGLRTPRWSVFVWAKNLANRTYVVYRDDRSASGVLQTTAYGDPRTVGATLSVPF